MAIAYVWKVFYSFPNSKPEVKKRLSPWPVKRLGISCNMGFIILFYFIMEHLQNVNSCFSIDTLWLNAVFFTFLILNTF